MKTIIIAEAGVNHNGSIVIAKKLIEEAAKAGADFIKFQSFITENLVTKQAKQADYQINNIGVASSQYEMLKKLELSASDHDELNECCKKNNISFLSTAFDLESIDNLIKYNFPVWKIPSGEITNLPYLLRVGSQKKEIILSTGMATIGEIEDAIEALESVGTKRNQITVLHCTTEYPAPIDEINLLAMQTIGHTFKVKYGYSDHTEGIEIPLAAVSLGAVVIEKHFTLDKTMDGPDHKASLEPAELMTMITGIRIIEKALGDGIKRPSKGEIKNRIAARKSIVAAKDIESGELFTIDNLTFKRPGNGISPMKLMSLIGNKANKNYFTDEQIQA